MNADEWREAVEELRDYCQESQRTMVRFNHTDRADVYHFVTEALTALLDRDEADRAEGARWEARIEKLADKWDRGGEVVGGALPPAARELRSLLTGEGEVRP